MKVNKLKQEPLNIFELVQLWDVAEKAESYTKKIVIALEKFDKCDKWARKIEFCLENIIIIQQEMRAKLELNGAFKPLGE